MSTADESVGEPSSSMDTPSEVPADELITNQTTSDDEDLKMFRFLVLDSGPIVKLKGMHNVAQEYVTVPAVVQEIRDAKARQHLATLDLKMRDASPRGIQSITEFAKQTGDYNSLSSVDLQVLGLLYDLEREANEGDVSHLRTTPKRVVGVGRIEALNKNSTTKQEQAVTSPDSSSGVDFFQTGVNASNDKDDEEEKGQENVANEPNNTPHKPKTWAMMVNPSVTGTEPPKEQDVDVAMGQLNLQVQESSEEGFVSGQFSDAEEEDEASEGIFEDEHVDFPTLVQAMQVPYEGSDEEDEQDESPNAALQAKKQADLERKHALKPITKSGKLYNSFRNYSTLVRPKGLSRRTSSSGGEEDAYYTSGVETVTPDITTDDEQGGTPTPTATTTSRIMGGTSLSGQGAQVNDDGVGWISSTWQMAKLKNAGVLDPMRKNSKELEPVATGPPNSRRAACSTTDFAMQNVILQMNLSLVSVDGMRVRKLKSWVTRCGACFAVYADGDDNTTSSLVGRRLFCSRCGSDMMQRVAASVDAKSGRLRLHLSKKYKHNLRGTKYSLPKPGTHNRFQGDLLLREDQLLMGAWNQKVKKRSGGKARSAAQSMFGSDLASNVGCNVIKRDDIKVGFGRRNPNAAKGRERRGKKKKSSDKACGLRRY